MSARRLSELDKGERRRAWLHTVAVLAVARVVLVGVYYLVPTGVVPASRSGADSFLRLGAGVALFAAILAGQTRRIIRAELPGLRAVEVLGVVIPCSWSSSRPGHVHRAARPHPGAVLHHHVFSTVGFGDLTPRAELARIIVSIQMLLDLVILGSVVRLLLNAAQIGLTRARDHSDQP